MFAVDYTILASKESVSKVADSLRSRNIEVLIVETKEEALQKIKGLIPKGASVNNGSSTTLQEIGFVDYLKSNEHGWNNLHAAVIEEKGPVRQAELRKAASYAEYYLGSVHAVSEDGEMVIASASGSQIPPLANTSKNLILVVGSQKITPNLEAALKRLREHVVPLEDQRMKSVGTGGTVLAKILIFEQEPAFMGRAVRVILVNEKLGF